MKLVLRKLLTLVVCVFCLGCSVFVGGCKVQKDTLYVYTHVGFPPYEYLNKDGKAVGVDLDIMQRVGKELGYKVRVCDVEFGAIFMKVQNNTNAIGASGITITPERKQSGIFSVPYTVSRQYVLVEKGAQVPLNEKGEVIAKEYLKDKGIGVQLATTGSSMVDNLIEEGLGKAKAFEYKNVLTAHGDIGGKIDCFVIDILPAKNIVKNLTTKLACYPLDEEPEWYGFYLNKKATKLKEEIDGVLNVLLAEDSDKDGISDYVQGLIDNHGG